METLEFLSGAIRLVPVIFVINSILIIHFFGSWFISAKKTGWTISPWYWSLFFSYFLPFLLMYPFASSNFNVISVGGNISGIQRTFNEAYFISLTGYLSIFGGSTIFKIYRYKTIVNSTLIEPFKNSFGYIFEKVVVNKTVSWFMFYLYLLALIIMLAVAYKAGSLNNPRGYFYREQGIGQALYNLTGSFSGIVSFILMTRIFQFNKLSDKIYLGVFVAGTVFIGSRSAALGPLMAVFVNVVYFTWKGKLKLKKIFFFGIIMLTMVTMLSVYRSGARTEENSAKIAGPFTEVLYGNTFSDLRDFAWVISVWNGDYLYGKTYLSAFMSFIPSAYSSFRAEWGIGKVTARLAGFDPKEHPGLRPGTFGESYLNFGLPGVVLLGLLLGYIGRYVDETTRHYAYTDNRIEVFKMNISLIFVGSLSITSGFFSVYVTLAIFTFLYLLKRAISVFN